MAKKRKPKASNVVIPFKPKARVDLKKTPAMFRFGLRGGFVGGATVLNAEVERLWSKVQEPDAFHPSIVFDSTDRRIALNVSHVIWSQFDGGLEPELQLTTLNGTDTVDILFAGSSTLMQLVVEPDECTIDDIDEGNETDEELIQLASLFFYFDSSHRGSDYAEKVTDTYGATTWLRLNDVSLFSAPRSYIVPTAD